LEKYVRQLGNVWRGVGKGGGKIELRNREVERIRKGGIVLSFGVGKAEKTPKGSNACHCLKKELGKKKSIGAGGGETCVMAEETDDLKRGGKEENHGGGAGAE